MRWMLAGLLFLLLVLQYRLWFGEGSYAHRAELTRQVEQQRQRNERLEERNRILSEEVEGLRHDPGAIEERARTDLGMIANDETFFLVLDKRKKQDRQKSETSDDSDAAEGDVRDSLSEDLLKP